MRAAVQQNPGEMPPLVWGQAWLCWGEEVMAGRYRQRKDLMSVHQYRFGINLE